MNFLKKLFCSHKDITVISEADFTEEQVVIIKSRIECNKCHKTFKEHPTAQCCYVHHLHGKIIQDKYIAMRRTDLIDKTPNVVRVK